ncbi:hypothetical protein DFH01_14930 [Falsiroseomonas bella]|uniref:Uncharacterized protein n=1 Tax=Falsiroseomonas bella TaxID=2184016 RepID=A0A317FFR9_9PROT|nr:hypothetical protein [Falsiroseomonas bella]PWS36448.1 hypothetical protein DFH01_14930 [Falsiroseomonas bella]
MAKKWLTHAAGATLFAAAALGAPQAAQAQWGGNYDTYQYGQRTPYRGGERYERFDREPDWSGYNQFNPRRNDGYGYGNRYGGRPYAGGERYERFDREPDRSGYNQYNPRRNYGGYGYGGDAGTRYGQRSERYYDRMEDRYDRLESRSDDWDSDWDLW